MAHNLWHFVLHRQQEDSSWVRGAFDHFSFLFGIRQKMLPLFTGFIFVFLTKDFVSYRSHLKDEAEFSLLFCHFGSILMVKLSH